jgi:hypothetical protein
MKANWLEFIYVCIHYLLPPSQKALLVVSSALYVVGNVDKRQMCQKITWGENIHQNIHQNKHVVVSTSETTWWLSELPNYWENIENIDDALWPPRPNTKGPRNPHIRPCLLNTANSFPIYRLSRHYRRFKSVSFQKDIFFQVLKSPFPSSTSNV